MWGWIYSTYCVTVNSRHIWHYDSYIQLQYSFKFKGRVWFAFQADNIVPLKKRKKRDLWDCLNAWWSCRQIKTHFLPMRLSRQRFSDRFLEVAPSLGWSLTVLRLVLNSTFTVGMIIWFNIAHNVSHIDFYTVLNIVASYQSCSCTPQKKQSYAHTHTHTHGHAHTHTHTCCWSPLLILL